jgi:purine-binding chemotaxis protein CheW
LVSSIHCTGDTQGTLLAIFLYNTPFEPIIEFKWRGGWRSMEELMEEARTSEGSREVRQLISFAVGAEEYGLELLRVKEVIRMRQITWLPKAPSFVRGIINLRGDVIPIVDLRERFGLAARDHTAMTRVIVVEVEGRMVGMVVDSASQVVRVPTDQFDPPPPIMGEANRGLITAIGKIGDRLVIMIDVDRILSCEEMGQIAGSLEAAEREPAVSRA